MDGGASSGGGDGGSFSTSTDAGSAAVHTPSTNSSDGGVFVATTVGTPSGNNSKPPHTKDRYLVLWIVVIILLGASVALAFWNRDKGNSGGMTACTEEAKLCPDGSYVGRTGPNCEFAPCPTPSSGL